MVELQNGTPKEKIQMCSLGEACSYGKSKDGGVFWDQSHSQKCKQEESRKVGSLEDFKWESDDYIFDEIHRRDRLKDEELKDEMVENEDEDELEDE